MFKNEQRIFRNKFHLHYFLFFMLNPSYAYLYISKKPADAKFFWLTFIIPYLQNALFYHQFHHAHAEIQTTLFQPDHQIPNDIALHGAVSFGTYRLHLNKASHTALHY